MEQVKKEQVKKSSTRLPPYSDDAEKSLLGAVLLEGDYPRLEAYVKRDHE